MSEGYRNGPGDVNAQYAGTVPLIDNSNGAPDETKEMPVLPNMNPGVNPGSTVLLDGRYQILNMIGSGGQGRVYLARDIKLGTNCAVKEINLTGGQHVHLLAEPEILKQLKHPSLPHITDIIRDSNNLYIVEEYFAGISLSQLIKSNRRLCSEENVIRWARELAQILHYLHNIKPHPIIYRDLKPDNIIIDSEGSVKLIDFGIAREYKAGQNSDTMYIGTRGYAAPEQYGTNQTDERTDIYSLGATLYHVVTGKGPNEPPFQILPLRQVNPQLSEGLEKIIEKCVRNDPAQRYQSAAELLYDLNNIHTLNREYRMAQLKKKILAGTVTVLILAAILGTFQFYRYKEEQKRAEFNQAIAAGTKAYQEGKFQEAENEFNQALELYQEDQVYLDFARIYLRKDDNQKVISYLQDKIDNGTIENNAEVQYLIGTAYFNLQNYEKSIWYFDQAVQGGKQVLGSEYDAAYRDLAVSYAKQGQYDKASEILGKLSSDSSFDKHIACYVKGELAQMENNYIEARDNYLQAVQMDQKNVRYKISLAQLYMQMNQEGVGDKTDNCRKAIQLLAECEDLDPGNVMVLNDLAKDYYDCGVLYEAQGDGASQAMYQNALVTFNKIRDLGLDDVDVLINIGILQDKSGNWKAAGDAYAQALQLDPDNSRANLVMGLFKLKQKQYTNAYDYLNRTVTLNQNPAEVATARNKINELREKGWIE